VEYFGADWCEPCKVVDQDLDDLVENDTFVMRHHPSPQDLTYNSVSNLRFNALYRLLFLPSLIHNGDGLLTGTSQAQDLGEVMSNSTTVFEGLTNTSYSNGTLSWNTTEQGTVTVWRLDAVAHETEPYNHSNMVIAALHFNATDEQGNITDLVEMNGTGFVVMLEREGVRNLTVKSETPAAGLDLNENVDDGVLSTIKGDSSEMLVVGVTIVLVFLLLPAFAMWKDAVGQQSTPSGKDEEA
jgi:thiol-disulfide isomerase/thioredoxin